MATLNYSIDAYPGVGSVACQVGDTVTITFSAAWLAAAAAAFSGDWCSSGSLVDAITVTRHVSFTANSITLTVAADDIAVGGLLFVPASSCTPPNNYERNYWTVNITLAIEGGALSLDCADPPAGVIGTPYSHSLTVTGGTAPFSLALASGALPDGLELDGSTGEISGTPTVEGTFTFTVTITDSADVTAEATCSITIGNPPPVFLCGTPPGSMALFDYQYQLNVTGGTAPFAWDITAGQLPDGLTLDPATGLISGTLTTAGSYTFTARVTDALGRTSSDTCGIPVSAPPSVECGAYTPGYTGTVRINYSISPYYLIEDSGPTEGWFHDHCTCTGFEVINDDGEGSALIGRKCACAGTPDNLFMSFSGEFFLYDPEAPPPPDVYIPHSITLSVTCDDTPGGGGGPRGPDSVDCNNPPDALPGVPYSHQIGVTGGTAPYAFAIIAGALPPGLSMSSSGLITGTPENALGTYAFTVRVTDSDGFYKDGICTISVVMGINCASPPVGYVGVAYSHQLATFGGTGPFAFEFMGGELPPGLAIDSAGLITGIPAAAGTFSFQVQVTDANGATATGTCTIEITLPGPPVGGAICLLLELWVWRQLRQFTSLDEEVQFPPGYADALRHNLAVDLATEFRRKASPTLLGLAGKMKANIAALNIANGVASEDPPTPPPPSPPQQQ